MLMDCSARGDLVLDLFLGSGTTIIAAERVGRLYYGLELDPLQVDTVIRRWQKFTGLTTHRPGTYVLPGHCLPAQRTGTYA